MLAEKDYRLARVAKISLFMNGAGEGNIIFGDGLENVPDKGIENGTFDILVANPPYAVKDFKQHLQLKNNSFTLLDRIGMNGGEIETLFVERIAQLLKPQGVAAVILPSSILSNDSASYTGARERLLQNFYIRGIAAFGSKTFGATGTNTVVMFLEKFNGMAPSFNEEQATYASVVNTKNMLDYSRVNFNKALRTSVKKAFHISSKYPLVKLASVCDLNTSKTEIHDTPDDLLVSFIDMASVSSEGFIERKVDRPYGEVCNGGYTYFAEGDFIIAKITPCMENGKCAIAEGLTNGIGFGSSEFHTFRCHASEILTKFLFLLLNQTTVRKAAEDAMTGASGHRRVPAAFYEEMLIPVPPIPVQQQVIDECAKIDEEYNATRMSIETYRQKTADLFAELDAVMSTTEGNRLSLSDTEKFSVAIGKRVLDKELASNGTIPVYSANVTASFGFIDKLLITDFSAPSVLWGIDGDWMTSYLPSDMPFYPTDHCGVLRCKNSEVNPRYLAHILEVEGRKMGFSRSYRASIDRVHGIAFTVPDISIQNNAMSKVADYEMAIKELEGSLEKIASRRSEIIRKALAE